MNRKARFALSVLTLFAAGATNSFGATIPAGTVLVVKTLEVIASSEAPGTKFNVELRHAVGSLPAGSKLSGKVVSSRRMMSSRERLTAELTEATVGNKTVPMKTAVLNLENFTGSSGVSFAHEFYHVPAGRTLKFSLSQPLQL
jgi:hypothetical protein